MIFINWKVLKRIYPAILPFIISEFVDIKAVSGNDMVLEGTRTDDDDYDGLIAKLTNIPYSVVDSVFSFFI